MNKKLEISQNDLKSENVLKSNGELKSDKNYFQVDIMKTWMIFLVILDHSTTHDFMIQFRSPLWERIAIPGFIIVMGFNLGISFKEKGITTLREAYSKEYFISKMKRYIIPYIILYFIQAIIYLLVYYVFQPEIIEVWPYDLEGLRFLGFTFLWGPGMWFIPALFGTILIFPLLYICFKNAPIATFIFCFLIEWFMHILSYNIYFDGWFFTKMFFTTHIFYLFSGIGMGLWISKDHEILSMGNEISSMVTIIFWILLPISLLYLIIFAQFGFYQLRGFMYVIGLGWIGGDYNFLSFPYSAFLFLIVLKIFPKNPDNKFSKIIKKISRSTYHILLFQILYFSIAYHFWFSIDYGFDSHPIDYLWYYPLNLLITIPGGIIWKTLESKFYKKINENKIYSIIYKIMISLAIGFYVFFLFSRYIFFIVYPIP